MELRRSIVSQGRYLPLWLLLVLGTAATAHSDEQNVDSKAGTIGRAFADHCFSPFLTAQKAQDALSPSGARFDFYDLRPFSAVAPSPVMGRAKTPGTDRRCEVAFDGEHLNAAKTWAHKGLNHEGLTPRMVDVPATFTQTAGTASISAVQLNPDRIAVLQIGIRPGPSGPETFMNVERLTPLSEGGS